MLAATVPGILLLIAIAIGLMTLIAWLLPMGVAPMSRDIGSLLEPASKGPRKERRRRCVDLLPRQDSSAAYRTKPRGPADGAEELDGSSSDR